MITKYHPVYLCVNCCDITDDQDIHGFDICHECKCALFYTLLTPEIRKEKEKYSEGKIAGILKYKMNYKQ